MERAPPEALGETWSLPILPEVWPRSPTSPSRAEILGHLPPSPASGPNSSPTSSRKCPLTTPTSASIYQAPAPQLTQSQGTGGVHRNNKGGSPLLSSLSSWGGGGQAKEPAVSSVTVSLWMLSGASGHCLVREATVKRLPHLSPGLGGCWAGCAGWTGHGGQRAFQGRGATGRGPACLRDQGSAKAQETPPMLRIGGAWVGAW